jgi:4-hydroxy-tetrahydrodipicolinate reductase
VANYNVVITGACGKVGKEMIKGINNCEDMTVVGAVDVINVGKDIGEIIGGKPVGVLVSSSLENLISELDKDKDIVLVDFTFKAAAKVNIPKALENGLNVVMGTTGFSQEELAEFEKMANENKVGMLVAPNFSLGAVLMMKVARDISRYLNQAEIIEYHNEKKLDSPSGTAIATARGMKENTIDCQYSEENNDNGARGAEYDGVRIHSVRLKSLVAHQEVIFSGCGELLTIRHDSFSRESFVPGVLLAVRNVSQWTGLKFGLETIMD